MDKNISKKTLKICMLIILNESMDDLDKIQMDFIENGGTIESFESALEEIRPYLRSDGGDISLVEITDDYTVKVKLMGACETCHVSMMTLKNGVEGAVKNAVPKVKKVIEISSQN